MRGYWNNQGGGGGTAPSTITKPAQTEKRLSWDDLLVRQSDKYWPDFEYVPGVYAHSHEFVFVYRQGGIKYEYHIIYGTLYFSVDYDPYTAGTDQQVTNWGISDEQVKEIINYYVGEAWGNSKFGGSTVTSKQNKHYAGIGGKGSPPDIKWGTQRYSFYGLIFGNNFSGPPSQRGIIQYEYGEEEIQEGLHMASAHGQYGNAAFGYRPFGVKGLRYMGPSLMSFVIVEKE